MIIGLRKRLGEPRVNETFLQPKRMFASHENMSGGDAITIMMAAAKSDLYLPSQRGRT